MSDVRFGYTIVYVPDVASALDFYSTAFGFDRRFLSDDGDYGELDTGPTTLGFASETLGASHFSHGFLRHSMSNPPFGTELCFTTADVDATLRTALDAGAHLLVPAEIKPWGQTVAWVRDPHGVLIEICTPIGE